MQSLQSFLSEHSNLAKVLGVGALSLGAIVCSGIVISKYSNESLSESSPRKKGTSNNKEPPGLKNYGNTCFINCILQALAGLPAFMNFLQKLCETRMEDSQLETEVPELLLETLNYLNDHDKETLYPGRLINALRDKVDFKFYQEQQDSHELLKLLMDIIDSALKEKNQDLSRSINPFRSVTDEQEQDVVNPLNGYIAQILVCDQCGQESNIKLECFNDLSLIIKERHIDDLKAAFTYYFMPETVDDVECIGCSIEAFAQKKKRILEMLKFRPGTPEEKEKYKTDLQDQLNYLEKVKKMAFEHKDITASFEKILKRQLVKYENNADALDILHTSFDRVKSRMKKCLRLARLPRILSINFQRLTYDRFGNVMKIAKHIEFDEELSLQPWLDKKLFSEDTVKSKYRLAAVIRHFGTENFGHYVTYRRICKQSEKPTENGATVDQEVNHRHEKNGAEKESVIKNGINKYDKEEDSFWSYTSDETTYVVDEREVLNSPAYILFYEKVC